MIFRRNAQQVGRHRIVQNDLLLHFAPYFYMQLFFKRPETIWMSLLGSLCLKGQCNEKIGSHATRGIKIKDFNIFRIWT